MNLNIAKKYTWVLLNFIKWVGNGGKINIV